MGLLREAALNWVCSVTGAWVAVSTVPKLCTHAISPRRITAIDSPGMRACCISPGISAARAWVVFSGTVCGGFGDVHAMPVATTESAVTRYAAVMKRRVIDINVVVLEKGGLLATSSSNRNSAAVGHGGRTGPPDSHADAGAGATHVHR